MYEKVKKERTSRRSPRERSRSKTRRRAKRERVKYEEDRHYRSRRRKRESTEREPRKRRRRYSRSRSRKRKKRRHSGGRRRRRRSVSSSYRSSSRSSSSGSDDVTRDGENLLGIVTAYEAQIALLAQKNGSIQNPEVQAYLGQLQQMRLAAQTNLLVNMEDGIKNQLKGLIPGLENRSEDTELSRFVRKHRRKLDDEKDRWRHLSAVSSHIRARDIRSIDDFGEKVRMVIHWIYSTVAEDESMDLYSTIVHCFTTFVSEAFLNIDIESEEIPPVSRFKEVGLFKTAVRENMSKFYRPAHVEMLSLLTDERHAYIPRLLSCEYALENLARLQAWIQKGFRAVEAAFVYELFYEPNFDRYFPPLCSRREQLDQTIMTHLHRFFTDHIKRMETDILLRRPHLQGTKAKPVFMPGSTGRGVAPQREAICISDAIKLMNSTDKEVQKRGLEQLEASVTIETPKPIRDLDRILQPANLSSLIQMSPSLNTIQTNQDLPPPQRLIALRVLVSLCGILQFEKQNQTIIDLGVVRKFLELFSHEDDMICYTSLVGVTNACFVSTRVMRRIVRDGLLDKLFALMRRKLQKLESLEKNQTPLGVFAVLKQISWMVLGIARRLNAENDPERFALHEIETALPIIKELLTIDDPQVVHDCSQALHALIATNIKTFTNTGTNIPIVMQTIPVTNILAVLKKKWSESRLNILSFIWKIIKTDEFHRKQFIDQNLVMEMNNMLHDIGDTPLARTCVRAVSQIILFLCDKKMGPGIVNQMLELLTRMLRSPDTETVHNTITALDILLHGTEEDENVFNDHTSSPEQDALVEYLIERQPCDYVVRQLACDDWTVQKAGIRLLDKLVSYQRKRWISLKWMQSSGMLNRIRVLLAHPNQQCREIALHVIVKLVERGRRTQLMQMLMHNRIFETVMTLRYLRPEFMHDSCDFVIDQGLGYANTESTRTLRRKQLELVQKADNKAISERTLAVLVGGLAGTLDDNADIRQLCATKLQKFMEPSSPDIAKRAEMLIANNHLHVLMSVGQETPELLPHVLHILCCCTLGNQSVIDHIKKGIISFFTQFLTGSGQRADSSQLAQIFWALGNICAATMGRDPLVKSLLDPILAVIDTFVEKEYQTSLQSAVGLLRVIVPSVSLESCGIVLIHCFAVLETTNTGVLINTLELLYGILLQVRDKFETDPAKDETCLDILGSLIEQNFPHKVKKHLSHTERDVQVAALKICLPLMECVRIKPSKGQCVTLAKETAEILEARSVKLLSDMMVSAKSSERSFALTFLYAIFALNEWQVDYGKRSKKKLKKVKKSIPKLLKDWNLFWHYPKLIDWFASSRMMYSLIGMLAVERNKAMKDMAKQIIKKVVEEADNSPTQMRKLRLGCDLTPVFTEFQDSEATLITNDELFVSSRHRILVYNDLYFIFTSWLMTKLSAKCPGLTSCSFQPLPDIISEFKRTQVITAMLNLQKNRTRVFTYMNMHNLEVFKYDTKYDRIFWPFPSSALDPFRVESVGKLIDDFLQQAKQIIAPGGQVIILFQTSKVRDQIKLGPRARKASWLVKEKGFRPAFLADLHPLDLNGELLSATPTVSILQLVEKS